MVYFLALVTAVSGTREKEKAFGSTGRFRLLVPLSLRGGSNYDQSSYQQDTYKDGTAPVDDRIAYDAAPPYGQYDNYNDPSFEPPVTSSAEDDPLQETVQERLDQWKTEQIERSAQYQESPRDSQGRMKLLTSVGKGSRAAIFFFLMWRDVHLYEAITSASSASRMLLAVPLISLFFANMAGAIVSLTSPSLVSKKRLKAILNLDKMVEVLLLFYAAVRLSVWPSRYTTREVYIGNCFHSAFFLLQCQAFTRLSWDENSAQPMSTYTKPVAAVHQQQQGPKSLQILEQQRTTSPQQNVGDDWYDSSRSPNQ